MGVSSVTVRSPVNNHTFPIPGIPRPHSSVRWVGGAGPFDVLHEWDTNPSFTTPIQDSNLAVAGTEDEGVPPSDLGPVGTAWHYRVTVTDTADSGFLTSTTFTLGFTDPQSRDRILYVPANVGVNFDPASGATDGDPQAFDRFLYAPANVGVNFVAGADGDPQDQLRHLYVPAFVTSAQPCPYITSLDPNVGRNGDAIIIRGQGLTGASSPTTDPWGAEARLYTTPDLAGSYTVMPIVSRTAGDLEDTIVAQIPAAVGSGHVAVVHTAGTPTCTGSNFRFLNVIAQTADPDAGWWVEVWELDGSAQKTAGPLPVITASFQKILNGVGYGQIELPSYLPSVPGDDQSANLVDLICDPDDPTKPWSLLRVFLDGILRYSFFARVRSKPYGPASEQQVTISGDGREWLLTRTLALPFDHPANPSRSPDTIYGSTVNAMRNGNFEDGGDPIGNGGAEDGVIDPWVAHLGGVVFADPGVQRSGGLSFKVTPSAAGDGARQEITVTPGLRYFFDVWVKDLVGSLDEVTLLFYWVDDADVEQALDLDTVTLNTAWTLASVAAVVPDNVTSAFVGVRYTDATGTPHDFWFDDVVGAGDIDPWQISGQSATARLTRSPVADGTYALEVTTLLNPGGVKRSVPTQPNTPYTIRVPVSGTAGQTVRAHATIGDTFVFDDVTLTGNPVFDVAVITGTTGPEETLVRIVVDGRTAVGQIFFLDAATAIAGLPAASPGTIMKRPVDQAQARGALTPISYTFTDTLDSNGDTWAINDLSTVVRHGMTLADLAERLVAFGFDWEITDTFQLRLVNELGIRWDLAGPDAPVIREGVPVKEGTIAGETPRHSWVYAEGADGRWTVAARPAWVTGLGYLETYLQNTTAGTETTLNRLAEASLAEEDERGLSVRLLITSDMELRPFVDYDVGDTVWLDLPGEEIPRGAHRVRSILVRLDGEGADVTYSVDFNRIEYEEAEAVSEAVARLLERGDDTVASGSGFIGSGSGGAGAGGTTVVLPPGGEQFAPVDHQHELLDIVDRELGGDLTGRLPSAIVEKIKGIRTPIPTAADDTKVWSYDHTSGGYVLIPRAAIDTTAIHTSAAGEIAAITTKSVPASADLLLIEDSAASNAKKKITIGSLPSGGGGGAGTWGPYTPVWTSSGTAPSLGNGSLVGRYVRDGNTVHGWIELVFGSTTTGGTGSWKFTLPLSVRDLDITAGAIFGGTYAENRGIQGYWLGTDYLGPGTDQVGVLTSGTSQLLSTSNLFTFGNTDLVRIHFVYETDAA